MFGILVKKRRRSLDRKRLIIVTGTALSKKATERNRLKRRIRAIMRDYLRSGEHDFTVILKKPALTLTFKELEKELANKIKQ